MKSLLMAMVMLMSITAGITYAADDKSKTDAASAEKAFAAQQEKVQAHMKLMQEQMATLQKTTDPAERQKLMEQHWASMQEGMRLIHGSDAMPGCGMMMGNMQGSGMHHGMMGGGWSSPDDTSSATLASRQQMMGSCMGMQHQMMNQMMQHQHMMQSPPAQ